MSVELYYHMWSGNQSGMDGLLRLLIVRGCLFKIGECLRNNALLWAHLNNLSHSLNTAARQEAAEFKKASQGNILVIEL